MKVYKFITAIGAGVFFSLAATAVHAKTEFPTKPITLIVPWSAGGSVDMTARRLGEALSKKGVKLIVENLAGASGTIGLNKVARSSADGYTLGLATTSLMGAITQKMTPITTASFTALNQTTAEQEILVVPNASPVKTIEDFVALMKAKPGGVSIGTPGAYTVNHVYAAMLAKAAGAELIHVPYTGGSKVLVDLAGNQIDAGVLKPSESQAQIESGLIRPIGAFATIRSEVFPETPTFQEKGLDVFPYGALPLISYIVAPGGLPQDVAEKIKALLDDAIMSNEYQGFVKQYGMRGENLQGDKLQKVIDEIQKTYDVVLPKIPK